VTIGPVVKRGWRTAATAFGLLFLAGGVVLVGVLTVRGAQASAARVAQFLGIGAGGRAGGRTDCRVYGRVDRRADVRADVRADGPTLAG